MSLPASGRPHLVHVDASPRSGHICPNPVTVSRSGTCSTQARSRLGQTALEYIPAQGLASFSVTSEDAAAVEACVRAVEEVLPLAAEVVFISYDTGNLDLADAVASLLRARLDPGTEIFVAKRSIAPGDDPLKRMLDGGLLRARALVAICPPSSKESPWLWWETGAVWARGELVIPLFAGISANEFDGPLGAVRHGGDCTKREDVDRILKEVVQPGRPGRGYSETTDEEFRSLQDAIPDPRIGAKR